MSRIYKEHLQLSNKQITQIKNKPGCGGLKREELVEGLHEKQLDPQICF